MDAFRHRGVGRPLVDIGADLSVDILKIVHDGWNRAREFADVHSATIEVEMTGWLVDGMQAAVRKGVVRSHKMISVLRGTESRSDPRSFIPDGLTDIAIHLRDIRAKLGDHGPHAIIECKRVAGNDAQLCRQYVVQGINRFKEAKYAGEHVIAFMVGYLVSGDIDAVTTRINQYLSSQGRQSEKLGSCTVLAEDWARSSRHSRPTRQVAIDLHHAFLAFQAKVS